MFRTCLTTTCMFRAKQTLFLNLLGCRVMKRPDNVMKGFSIESSTWKQNCRVTLVQGLFKSPGTPGWCCHSSLPWPSWKSTREGQCPQRRVTPTKKSAQGEACEAEVLVMRKQLTSWSGAIGVAKRADRSGQILQRTHGNGNWHRKHGQLFEIPWEIKPQKCRENKANKNTYIPKVLGMGQES